MRCVPLTLAHVLNTHIDTLTLTKNFLQLSEVEEFDFFDSKVEQSAKIEKFLTSFFVDFQGQKKLFIKLSGNVLKVFTM